MLSLLSAASNMHEELYLNLTTLEYSFRGIYQMMTTKWGRNEEHIPWGFPGGAVVKNPPANAGDMGSSPGPGRSHMPWSN